MMSTRELARTLLDQVPESKLPYVKDLKVCQKQHCNMALHQQVINVLAVPESFPPQNRDHSLTGSYLPHRECHIQPDWLLIYLQTDPELYLYRTGTHADLFGL